MYGMARYAAHKRLSSFRRIAVILVGEETTNIASVIDDLVERADLLGKFDLFHETRQAIRARMIDESENISYLIVVEDVPIVYVGSSARGRRRINEHVSELRNGIHPKKSLQDAFNAGLEIVVYFRLTESEDEASDLEQQLLDVLIKHPWCCNEATDARKAWVRKNGTASFAGNHHSEETKLKLSKIRKEYYRTNDAPFLGRNHTEESKKKLSEAAQRPRSALWLSSIRQAAKRNAGPKHHNARAVVIDGVEYGCVKDAADALGINYSTVYQRIKNDSSVFVEWKLK